MIQIEAILLVGRGSTDGLLDHACLLGHSWRLVMIAPWNCTARSAENRAGMHGHVSKAVSFNDNVLGLHRDALFEEFPCIDVFNDALLLQVRPQLGGVQILEKHVAAQTLEMNERKDDRAHIAKNQDAVKACNDRSVFGNHLFASSRAKDLDENLGRLSASDGIAIDKDNRAAKLSPLLEPLEMQRLKALILGKIGNALEKIFNEEAHVDANSHGSKECQILQETRAVTFGRLGRTLGHELSAVDPAHERVLAIARQGRRNTLNMSTHTQWINLMCHLNDARARIARLLDCDFAFGKGLEEVARKSIRMSHKSRNVEVLVSLESILHLVAKRLDKH